MLWEVPLTVALHFLGVPEEDMDLLRQYSIAHTVNTWGRPKPEEQVAVAHAVGNFWQLAGRILDKMREDPSGPGWMQYGLRKQKDLPEVVTDSYLHSMMMAGIVAAHETTANASANAIKLLLQHPDAWREICDDPSLIPNAVEECLRHNGSVAAWRRLVTRDAEVGGIRLPAGSKLLIVTSSANHDERHFADADLFDIRRDNASEQLTFGYGSHQCMGKNLARMEMQVFLEELTRRLPHMRLAGQTFTYVPNTSFRGPEHLLVEWDPAQNPERRDPALLDVRQPVRIGERPRTPSARTAGDRRASTPAADGVVRLRLAAPDGKPLPRWAPGSHIDVECGDTGLSRQYSLCGDPDDAAALEIAVLRDPDSRGGSAWVHGSVQAGDRLRIRGPRNHFRFDEGCQRAIFIAGGIGITPVSAMARRAVRLASTMNSTTAAVRARRWRCWMNCRSCTVHGCKSMPAMKASAPTSASCWRSRIRAPGSTPAARSACWMRWPSAARRGRKMRCAWSTSYRSWARWMRRRSSPLPSSSRTPAWSWKSRPARPC